MYLWLCNDKLNANLLILLACTYVIHTQYKTVKSSILQQIDLLPNQQVRQQQQQWQQNGKQMEEKEIIT